MTDDELETLNQLCDRFEYVEVKATRLRAVIQELRRLRASLSRLEQEWRAKAVASREEAGRIRRTIKEPTDAEARCLVRLSSIESREYGKNMGLAQPQEQSHAT